MRDESNDSWRGFSVGRVVEKGVILKSRTESRRILASSESDKLGG
jgi:hypothetical protein